MNTNKFHHYTTIDTLALILKSKKLRFTRLDLVDDIEEANLVNKKITTQYFISCWTLDDKESIPLWNMYSGTRGIRISTRVKPISIKRHYSKNDPNEYFESPILNGSNMIFDEKENRNFIYYPLNNKFSFYKVVYKPEKEVDSRKSICVSDTKIILSDLAGLKTDYWSFQKEYRMIIKLDPVHQSESVEDYLKQMQDIECGFNYIDFDLSQEFLDNLEVTFGPLCSESDKIIVKSLLENFTTNRCSSESELFGKIRR